jgi:hypothetical protein
MTGMPNITPFTYRDGSTYLNELELYKRYIERDLIPWVQTNYDALSADFIVQVNLLITSVNMAIEAVLNDSVEVQDAVVAQLVENSVSLTAVALDAKYVQASEFNTLGDDRYVQLTEFNSTGDARYVQLTELTNLADPRYTVYRLWTGSDYPARIPGALNIFFGPNDPGLAMSEGDYWANPDATSMAEVVAEAGNNASPLYAAIQQAMITPQQIELYPPDGSSIVRATAGVSPNRISGWALPDSASSIIYGSVRVPSGWTNVKFTVRWTHDTAVAAASSSVRLYIQPLPMSSSSTGVAVQQDVSSECPAQKAYKDASFTASVPVTSGGEVAIGFGRLGTSGADTFVGEIIIIDMWMERQ